MLTSTPKTPTHPCILSQKFTWRRRHLKKTSLCAKSCQRQTKTSIAPLKATIWSTLTLSWWTSMTTLLPLESALMAPLVASPTSRISTTQKVTTRDLYLTSQITVYKGWVGRALIRPLCRSSQLWNWKSWLKVIRHRLAYLRSIQLRTRKSGRVSRDLWGITIVIWLISMMSMLIGID